MMIASRSLLVGVLRVIAIALVPAACGARGPLEQDEPDAVERDAVTAAALEELSLEGALLDDTPVEQALVSVASPTAPLPLPAVKVLRAWGAPVPASCWTVESSTDADADGIPAAANILFGCTSSAAYDVSGASFVSDDDDHDAASGFTLVLGGLRVSEPATVGADARSHTLDGSFQVRARPGAIDSHMDAIVAVTGTANGDALSNVSFRATGTSTYVADADLDTASRSRRGNVTSTVEMTITDRGVARAWKRQPAPSVHWNLSCKTTASAMPGFDGGAAVYSDDRGNVLRIELTSCTTWTVTLNGVGY